MECVDALREPDCGVLEGRGDAKAWSQHTYWMKKWLSGQERNTGPQGGETFEEVRKRFGDFIESLVIRFGATESEFLLITHGALLLIGLPGILAGVDHQFLLDHTPGYTALITTEYKKGMLACVEWEPEKILVGN
jgi:broad specificity phosphatase PhoE